MSGCNITYNCSTPLPRSAFDEDGPLCDPLAQYLYDPANCDPGFWCGCSSTDPDLCWPSNDTTATLWGGHYTTTDLITGENITLVGWFSNPNDTSVCPPHYYCPGRNDVNRCVDLCPPEKLCPDPSQLITCPEDGYCPVASIEVKECVGLEQCSGDGLRRFQVFAGNILILIVIIVAILYLYVGRYLANRTARIAKEEKQRKLAAEMEKMLPDDADLEKEEGRVEEKEEAAVDENSVENVETDGEVSSTKRRSSDGIPQVPQYGRQYSSNERPSRRRSSIVTQPELEVDIEFEKLRLTIPGVGTIMRGVSGSLKHGQLTAVMGPSGAGKTTFLSIMSGKVSRTGGTLKVNGQVKELTGLRRIIGYVPQEDVMLRELSVEENIRHSALMRLPRDWPLKKKLDLIDETLESLEIDHIRDSIVGDEKRRGISGGQRKRVNIALEMVAKPSLLCLDEPTSGLDSTTSLTVLQSLKAMAESGINVVAVLHQPKYEIFKLFDQVLLLGQGGMTVYLGPAEGMTSYFEKRGFPCPERENPADYYMDVLSGIIPHATDPNFDSDDLFEEWMKAPENPNAITEEEAKAQTERIRQYKMAEKQEKKSEEKRNMIARFCGSIRTHLSDLKNHLGREFNPELKTTRAIPGYSKQTQLLFKRAALQRKRTPNATVLNIVLMVLAGAVLPSLVPDDTNLYIGIPNTLNEDSPGQEAYFRQNTNPVDQIPSILTNIYFFLLIVSCLSVNVFGSERTVFFRETAAGQLVFSYWFAKTIETFLWLPIYTAGFVLLGYSSDAWLLQPMRRYWAFLLIDLVGFYGFGMLTSLWVGAGSAALFTLVFGLIIIISFSATVTAFGDSNVQGLIQCWFVFWSTQGLCSEEYDQYTYAFNVTRLNDETPDKLSSDFGIGNQAVGAGVGKGYDLSASYAKNIGICALTAFAWHIIVLWTLKTKDHKKQR